MNRELAISRTKGPELLDLDQNKDIYDDSEKEWALSFASLTYEFHNFTQFLCEGHSTTKLLNKTCLF